MSLFIARQPILDLGKKTFAYELLFRSGLENSFGNAEPNQACVRVFHDSVMEYGLNSLVGASKAFYNVTRQGLVDELYTVLPRDKVVLELLENIAPDAEVIAACEKLKCAGYQLALDDFVFSPAFTPLVEIADIVKVDFLATSEQERRRLPEAFAAHSLRLLAEKVETLDEFEEAGEHGYELFQGYFFCRPEILSGVEIPKFKTNYLRFLREVRASPLNLDRLEASIKQEMSLSVKLFRLLNSAAFSLTSEVSSIRRALMLLGEVRLRKWASVVALAGIGSDKPSEIVVTGFVRAEFCELVAERAGLSHLAEDLFLCGMLSVVDALVGRPMGEVLADLTLAPEVVGTLLGETTPLSAVFDLSLNYERGAWTEIDGGAESLGLPGPEVVNCYRHAVLSAAEVFNAQL